MERQTVLSKKFALFTIFVLWGTLSCFGQAFTATFTGVLSDSSGGAITGARVDLTNTATHETRTVKTGAEGRYVFSQLLPGRYELLAEAPGFKVFVQKGIDLNANQTAEANVVLQVGSTGERVEVTAAAPPLDTQTADQAFVLGANTMESLPLNTRTPLGFIRANGGFQEAFDIRNSNSDQNYNRFGINGGRTESSAILIDGVPATSGSQWNGLIYSPTVDSVQEVQIISNSYDVQFGRSGGAVVSMVTKGGSAQFHGSAFEYFRNSKLDANNFFTNRAGRAKPFFGRNQFGGTLGGPVWKSKRVFFFGSYEGLRQGTPGSRLTTVPTALQRQGDFSQTFNPNGTLQQIYDPFSTVIDASGNATRAAFQGNKIPQQQWDTVGANVLSLYPLPNQPGDRVTGANNWFGTGKNVARTDRYDIRGDWVRTDKHSLYVVWSQSPVQTSTPPIYTGWGIGEPGTYSSNPRSHATLGNTFTPNPTLVINVLAGYGAWTEKTIPVLATSGTALGFPQSLVRQFQAPGNLPQVTLANYATIGSYQTLNHPESTRLLETNVTKQLGAHSLRFGYSMEFGYENGSGAGGWVTAPQFNFNQGFTSGPVVTPGLTSSGNAIASLLLGTGAGGNDAITAPLAEAHHDYGFYLQDAWRVNSRLTLNYGLRYELQQPSTDRYDRFANFYRDIPSPLAGPTGLPLKGGLVYQKDAKLGRGAWDTRHQDFAPRISAAYKLTNKLVARGGFGVFYLPLLGIGTLDGYSLNTAWQTSVGGAGLQPLARLNNPFPSGIQAPPGSSLGLLADVGNSVPFQERKYPSSYVENYSFDLQYQIGSNSVVEIGYSGNQGHHLTFSSANINQLPASYLSLGPALNAQVKNPFYGTPGALGVYASPTTAAWRLLTPYPQFTGVNLVSPPAANSTYNALLVKYSTRMSHGFTTIINYSFSKAIDDASETQAWEVGDSGPRDAYNWKLERSISAHDIPQSLAVTLVYDVPVGKGRTFGANMNRVAEAVAGGWQVASIMNFQNGIPVRPTASGNGFGFAYQPANIADFNAVKISNPTVEKWFNTSALTQPAPYTIGTAPRRITQLRQDGVHSADVSIMKNFNIREPLRLQFRAEFFNISNTPQFAAPNTTVGSSTFGQVTGIWAPPRSVQFGLRLSF